MLGDSVIVGFLNPVASRFGTTEREKLEAYPVTESGSG
jgi:hypothetical protein